MRSEVCSLEFQSCKSLWGTEEKSLEIFGFVFVFKICDCCSSRCFFQVSTSLESRKGQQENSKPSETKKATRVVFRLQWFLRFGDLAICFSVRTSSGDWIPQQVWLAVPQLSWLLVDSDASPPFEAKILRCVEVWPLLEDPRGHISGANSGYLDSKWSPTPFFR